MPEDPTKDLTAVEMLRMLLADVRDMKGRLSAVETELATLNTTVEDRFKDTRPIWQAINQRTERIEARAEETNARLDILTECVTAVEKELQSVNRQFETFSIDHMKMRSDIRGLNARLTEMEQKENRPN